MNLTAVCLRLENGEHILAETDGVIDQSGFMTIYYPYIVQVTKNQHIMLVPWNPLCKDGPLLLQGDKVLYFTQIDEYHRQIYGNIVFTHHITKIKNKTEIVISEGIDVGSRLEDIFESIMSIADDISRRYNLPAITDRDYMRDQFFEFVMNNTTTPAPETIQ